MTLCNAMMSEFLTKKANKFPQYNKKKKKKRLREHGVHCCRTAVLTIPISTAAQKQRSSRQSPFTHFRKQQQHIVMITYVQMFVTFIFLCAGTVDAYVRGNNNSLIVLPIKASLVCEYSTCPKFV